MPLTVHPETRFACEACGECCGGWPVFADDAFCAGLDEPALRAAAPWLTEGPLVLEERGPAGERERFVAKQGYWCVFREPAGTCLVHRVQGFAAKPLDCQIFPHLLLLSPAGPLVSLRPLCLRHAACRRPGPLPDEELARLLPAMRQGPRVFWPAELRLAPGRSLPGSEWGSLRARLLDAVEGAAHPYAALRALARLVGAGEATGDPPGDGLLPAIPELAACAEERVRQALGCEQLVFQVRGQHIVDPATPYLERLLASAVLGRQQPGRLLAAARQRDRDADEQHRELLRRFLLHGEFGVFEDLATACGLLVGLLLVSDHARPRTGDAAADRDWLSHALAYLLRGGALDGTSPRGEQAARARAVLAAV